MNKHDRLNELVSWLSGIEGEYGGEKEIITDLLFAGRDMRRAIESDIRDRRSEDRLQDATTYYDESLGVPFDEQV